MPKIQKYQHVSDLLERRVRHGDYLLKEFPTDRQLAAEFTVDTRTARRAVAALIDAGLLVRQPNGRPAVATVAAATGKQTPARRVALLGVAYPTPYVWRWQHAIQRAADGRGAMFRPVSYVHLDDAVVQDTLDGFDGVFIGLAGEDPTDHLLRTIARSGTPTVFLDADLSAQGFPSLWLAAPSETGRLLDHLAGLGHERVACLNTQAHNNVTVARLAVWRDWTRDRDAAGRLVDDPVRLFGSPTEQAHRATLAALDDGGFDATALLCCTSAAAKGVYRACHERGVEVGRDLAVCSIDDGAGEAPYFIPSLTSLRDPDPAPFLETCLDWIDRGGNRWRGPLLLQPAGATLFAGESTHGLATAGLRGVA